MLHIALPEHTRRSIDKRINVLAEQGIRFSMDARAVRGAYIFCTARHVVPMAAFTDREITHMLADLVHDIETAGHAVLLSVWTSEEPDPSIHIEFARRAGKVAYAQALMKYRYINYRHNNQQCFGVLRQHRPAALFDVLNGCALMIASADHVPPDTATRMEQEATEWHRHMRDAPFQKLI